jgi:hypothetical protein
VRREIRGAEHVLLRCLIYGQGGTGKTRFVGTLDQDERTAPVLVVNAAGNPITILSNSPPPVVATLEALKDLDVIYAFLKSGQPKKHKFREAMELPPEVVFKSLAIDTLTEVQVMKNEELSKAAGGAVTRAGNPLQIQEWGESLRFMVHVTRLLYDLDLHVILTAQERIDLGTGRGKRTTTRAQ